MYLPGHVPFCRTRKAEHKYHLTVGTNVSRSSTTVTPARPKAFLEKSDFRTLEPSESNRTLSFLCSMRQYLATRICSLFDHDGMLSPTPSKFQPPGSISPNLARYSSRRMKSDSMHHCASDPSGMTEEGS